MPAPGRIVRPRKTILVIEDQELNRDLLVQILEDFYAVIVAVDGAEGLARAEQDRPDLILMDFGMPVMDGWEATRRIKAHPELRQHSDHRHHLARHGGRRGEGAHRPAATTTWPSPSTRTSCWRRSDTSLDRTRA